MAWDWDKIFGIGSQAISTIIGLDATKKAGKAGKAAADQAALLAQQQYERTRADLQPWVKQGTNAVNMLGKLNTPGAMPAGQVQNYLSQLPGYQFSQAEGEKALQRGQAAKKDRYSPRAGKEMLRWNSERLAGPAFNNWQNQLNTMAGYQQVGQVAEFGQQNAATQGMYGGQAGKAMSDAATGASGLWNNALTNTAGMMGPNPNMDAYQKYLKSLAGRN